ncbi:MAG: tRNA (adenosine(37)-N6)-dimethylallyltransferase MiaA [Elusimicrobiota bacterium]
MQENSKSLPTIIAIVGPTAAGKTAIAIALAKHLKTEVVSCDSRSFYKGLKTITATPAGHWQTRGKKKVYVTDEGVVYHLVDFLDPRKRWDARTFTGRARRLLREITVKTGSAIVAGGSGFYYRALFHGLTTLPGADPSYRRRLEAQIASKGLPYLSERLKKTDPATWTTLDHCNPRRVVRALELCHSLGMPLSRFLAAKKPPQPLKHAAFYVDWSKKALDKRIASRIKDGFPAMTDEARRFMQTHGDRAATLPASEALLLRPLIDHCNNAIDATTAIAACYKRDSGYAKRQRTWFKKEPSLVTIPALKSKALVAIKEYLYERNH